MLELTQWLDLFKFPTSEIIRHEEGQRKRDCHLGDVPCLPPPRKTMVPAAVVTSAKDAISAGSWTLANGGWRLVLLRAVRTFVAHRSSLDVLLIRDTPHVRLYGLNVFRMRGSRLWGSRLHRACVV